MSRRPGAVSVALVLRFLRLPSPSAAGLEEAVGVEEGFEEVSQVAALLFGKALDERQEALEPRVRVRNGLALFLSRPHRRRPYRRLQLAWGGGLDFP